MKTASVGVVLLSLVFNACEDLQRFESAAKRYKSGESLSVSVVRTGSAFPEPAVVRLQNGDLLAIFQEPGGKKSRESAWMACRSTNFGEDWSKPVQVIAAAGTFQNPALFQMDDGLVVLTLGTAAPAARQDGKTGFFISRSYDNGFTFTVPRWIIVDGYERILPSRRAALLEDGSILLPLEARKRGGGSSILAAVTNDRGETWTVSAMITPNPSEDQAFRNPAAVRISDGSLFCMVEGPGPFLFATASKGDALVWDQPRNTGIEGAAPDLLVSRDGTTVCAFRDLWPAGVSVVRSFNHGTTWEREVQIAANDQGGVRPALAEASDEDLLCLVGGRTDGATCVSGVLFGNGGLKAPHGLTGGFKTRKTPGIHLRWNAVQGAVYYLVYRDSTASAAVEPDTAFHGSLYGTSVKTQFVDTRVDTNRVYTYRVAAVRASGRPLERTGGTGTMSTVVRIQRKKE